MKKVILGIAVLLVVLGFVFFNSTQKDTDKGIVNVKITPTPQQVLSATNSKEQKSLFVPYWALTQEKIPSDTYDQFIYFGIAVNDNGIDKEESGYVGLARFVGISGTTEKLLTIRMLDAKSNFAVLKDQALQQKIITETIATAKQYGFKGIVLDLEISSLPFASVTNQMDSFVKDFSNAAKKENLTFSMMFFGDTFYRLRSYDVLSLAKYLDYAFIMAYDFSKARLDPGPNFPLSGKEKYGYDFTVMVNDFLNVIPKEKLTVVFGMFGYDWTVDENKKSIKQAVSLSLYQIKEKFLTNCRFKNCSIKRDETSAETEVRYTDAKGDSHIVWFEDEVSATKKQEFLKEQGINSIGFWAYSFFDN